eukprot:233064_1
MCKGNQLSGSVGCVAIILVIAAFLVNQLTDYNVGEQDVICEWEQICVGGTCEEYDKCRDLTVNGTVLFTQSCDSTKTAGKVYLSMVSISFFLGAIGVLGICMDMCSIFGRYGFVLYSVCGICSIIAPVYFVSQGEKGAMCYDKDFGEDVIFGGSLILVCIAIPMFFIAAGISLRFYCKSDHDESLLENQGLQRA